MTRDEILNMPAGTEMNTAIDLYVFGIEQAERQVDLTFVDGWAINSKTGNKIRTREHYPLPDYSGDNGIAWLVEERCTRFLVDKQDKELGYREWYCEIAMPNTQIYHTEAETMPLAVCRAVLLAAMEQQR